MARILTVTNLYPPHYLGGYELSCADVMERLVARGHEVTVLTTTTRRPDVTGERSPNIPVIRSLEWWWDDHVLTNPSLPARAAQEWRTQRALVSAFREVRPDVVSIWNVGAMSMGIITRLAMLGAPMVFAVCDEWPVYGPKLDAWGRLFNRSPIRRLCGKLVTASTRIPTLLPEEPWPGAFCFISDAAQGAAERARGWTFPRSAVVYSGIQEALFPIAAGPQRDRPWRGRLLYMGRVEHRKGVEAAVRALAELPTDVTLDIDGPAEPAYLPQLDRIIDELDVGGRIRMTQSDRSDLPQRYRDADAFIFPSQWQEPFGLTPLEAMACDTPVVATATGGAVEYLVDGTNCMLVPPSDPGAIARAVQALAADPALRARLVANGRSTAARFGITTLADAFEAWHVYAANGFAGAPPPARSTASDGPMASEAQGQPAAGSPLGDPTS